MVYLADVLADQGELTAAERLAQEAGAVYERLLPAGHWRLALAASIEGKILSRQGRLDEAKRVLDGAWKRLREIRGERALWTRRTRAELDSLSAQ